MTFNLDSINNRVIHCTNQFETDILANDFTTDADNWGGYSTSGVAVVGGTPNTTAQAGVTHGGATMDDDGTALKKVWQIAVGKYERIRYKFEIFADSDNDAGDVAYGILVPASSVITQLRHHTFDVPIPAEGGTQELVTFHDTTVAASAGTTKIPEGSWIQLNGNPSDALADEDGEGIITVSGVLEAAGTAGNLGFYFAQAGEQDAPTRIKAGSTFQYLRF